MYVTRQSTSIIKVGLVYTAMCILRCLKEGLPWSIDEWLQDISNIMLFKIDIYSIWGFDIRILIVKMTIL